MTLDREPALDLSAYLSAAEAALQFKQLYTGGREIRPATINSWYARGHLDQARQRNNGVREYPLGQLLKAERDTRRHPNSSRSTVRRLRAAA